MLSLSKHAPRSCSRSFGFTGSEAGRDAAGGCMKIREIRTYLMQVGAPPLSAWAADGSFGSHEDAAPSSRNWLFVRVLTDQGIVGIGECSGWPRVVETAVSDLAPLLIGEDPADIERLCQKMHI